jgi:hypothetical protein
MPGMNYEEVVHTLGAPLGDYGSENREELDVYGEGVLMMDGALEEWWSDEIIIQIGFDENRRVLWKRKADVILFGKPWFSWR